MKTLMNIIWLIFGGLILSAGWAIAGLLCYISIIGIPLGIPCMKIAKLCLAPFGKIIVYGTSMGSFVLNFIWLIFCGLPLAIGAFSFGIVSCITLIGIPFGLQYFKLAKLALMPFGSKIMKPEAYLESYYG